MSGADIPIVQSIEGGFDSIKQQFIPVGSRSIAIADFEGQVDLSIVFYNDELQTPLKYIKQWKELIRNYNPDTGYDDGTFQLPLNYWRPISVDLQDNKMVTKYTLYYFQCFPTITRPLILQYENSTRSVIMQAFSVNRLRQFAPSTSTPSTPTPTPTPTPYHLFRINIILNEFRYSNLNGIIW